LIVLGLDRLFLDKDLFILFSVHIYIGIILISMHIICLLVMIGCWYCWLWVRIW